MPLYPQWLWFDKEAKVRGWSHWSTGANLMECFHHIMLCVQLSETWEKKTLPTPRPANLSHLHDEVQVLFQGFGARVGNNV
jgi:hypothetical protein